MVNPFHLCQPLHPTAAGIHWVLDENGINLDMVKQIKKVGQVRIRGYAKQVPAAAIRKAAAASKSFSATSPRLIPRRTNWIRKVSKFW